MDKMAGLDIGLSSHDQMDFLNGQNNLFYGPKTRNTKGQEGPIVRTRVANQNTGFASPCLLAQPAVAYSSLVQITGPQHNRFLGVTHHSGKSVA